MTLTLESPRQPSGPASKTRLIWAAAIAAVVVVAFILLSFLNTGPRKIALITVRNDTPYDLQIDLNGQAKGGSTTPLGIVPAKQTTQFPAVIDVGPTWHISVTSQGHNADQLVIPRRQLAAQGWHLEFGASVTGRLHQEGLEPSPTSS